MWFFISYLNQTDDDYRLQVQIPSHKYNVIVTSEAYKFNLIINERNLFIC